MLASITAPNKDLLQRLACLLILLGLAGPAWPVDSGQFTVTPAATGRQLVRVSVPIPKDYAQRNMLSEKAGSNTASQIVVHGPTDVLAAWRLISWTSTEEVVVAAPRRAMLTFAYDFKDTEPITFRLGELQSSTRVESSPPVDWPVQVEWTGHDLQLAYSNRQTLKCAFRGPARTESSIPNLEVVEQNEAYRWKRYFFADSKWPRWIEIREDQLGTVTLVAHVQRIADDNGFAPDLGWRVTGQWDHRLAIYHPLAVLHQRATISDEHNRPAGAYEYWRCKESDAVPMQPYAWQRVEIVIAPADQARLPASLTTPHSVAYAPVDLANLYPHWTPHRPVADTMTEIINYHQRAICAAAAVGDDFGNVTSFNHGSAHGGNFGMNRLNHNAPIFELAWQSPQPCLLRTALQWCYNFHDQSIWWGEPKRGGTRYNNLAAQNKQPPTTDYMWRSNDSVHFCTKGYDSFWLAYEETGDPRMLIALQQQLKYAAEYIHADQGECRNIGDVRDFVRLYRMTGQPEHLDQALRLFRQLRTKLSSDHLFDQGGKPLSSQPPFIDDDQRGLTVGYAKPYIIGYALAGLPELLAVKPDEPQLRETIKAVADFLASTVDPAGGWRYPHPRSSLTLSSFGPEHAWHLTQACRALGPEPQWLDAIETVLRARIHGFKKSSTILSAVEGWEITSGKVKTRLELQDLYPHPEERDFQRDWTEGKVSYGSAPPEGLVYFADVLDFYLQHRSVERLMRVEDNEPLALVLNRQ